MKRKNIFRKSLAIGIIFLFVGAGLVLPSGAETIEKESDETDESELFFNRPVIDHVSLYRVRKAIFGYRVSFLLTASDPDGDIISCYYKKTDFDYKFHYAGTKQSGSVFYITFIMFRGSFTAHFVVRDIHNLFSPEETVSYKVPR